MVENVKHKWTEAELNIVRRDYKGTNRSAQEIANRLGVTFCGVKGKVMQLGVAKKTDRKPWGAKEEDKLRELITRYSPRTVAKKMNRSLNSVVLKSKRLGLSRRERDGWFTKMEVCEIFGVDHKWVQRRIDNGELKASWHNGIKPCQNGGACWHIWESDLRDYIVNHTLELQGRNVDLFHLVNIVAG